VAADRLVEFARVADGTDFPALSRLVAADGIEAHEDEVRAVVVAARRRGINPVWCSVLADPTAPAVARLRAWGRVVSAVSELPSRLHASPGRSWLEDFTIRAS
jgi:hypothetical protein